MARFIDVSPPRVNEFVLRKRAVTPDTDMRLARNYGMSFFLRLQVDMMIPL
jgi:plasmid maintenance system antidote protein VapI